MKIVLKNIDVINSIKSANEIMQIEGLPIKTSWNLAKNMKKLDKVFKTYVELEQKLVNEYAIKDDDGKVKVDENNNPKFPPRTEYFTKREELMNCEDEFEFLKIKLSDLDGKGISSIILYNLDFMIDDTDE